MESKKSKLEIKIFRPFGPSIIKIKMPDEIVIKMNEYVDKIISDKNKSKDDRHILYLNDY